MTTRGKLLFSSSGYSIFELLDNQHNIVGFVIVDPNNKEVKNFPDLISAKIHLDNLIRDSKPNIQSGPSLSI